MVDIGSAAAFSFRERPTPVPADLRIRWRVAVLLLLLNRSRNKRASLAKLYVLSDAIQSTTSRVKLDKIITRQRSELTWRLRVEPALARALDLMTGDGLTEWTTVSDKAGVKLTAQGEAAAKAVEQCDDILVEEKTALSAVSAAVTEAFVKRLISSKA